MYIKNMHLNHYRNYEMLSMNAFGNVNLILGRNAQGKTNLLEALFVLALTKSHRTSKDKELIAFGQDQALVTAEVDKRLGKVGLEPAFIWTGEKSKN